MPVSTIEKIKVFLSELFGINDDEQLELVLAVTTLLCYAIFALFILFVANKFKTLK